MWDQLSTTCSNILKYPNGELIVAVDRNQIRTMALETVDPIDCSCTVPYELHVLHGVTGPTNHKPKPENKKQNLLQQPEFEHASSGMPDQRTACEATRGIT